MSYDNDAYSNESYADDYGDERFEGENKSSKRKKEPLRYLPADLNIKNGKTIIPFIRRTIMVGFLEFFHTSFNSGFNFSLVWKPAVALTLWAIIEYFTPLNRQMGIGKIIS